LLCRRRTSFHHSSRADRNADRLAVPQGNNRAMFRCPHDRQSLGRCCRRLATRSARRRERSEPGHPCRLPASDAGLRLSKERIDQRLELSLREVTCRRSVILAEIIDDTVPAEPEPVGEDLRPLSCFAFATGKDTAHLFEPRGGYHCAHTRSAALVEWPIGDRNARLNHDIRVGDKENHRHTVEGRTEQLDCNPSSVQGNDKDG
jgi:hypothetical protein